jgi:hypothetical protein
MKPSKQDGAGGGFALVEPEDMESYMKDITDRMEGARLSAFLREEPRGLTELTNSGGQVRTAQRALRRDKYAEEEYSDLEGAAGVGRTGRRELVLEEMIVLDGQARALIQANSTKEVRGYLLPFETAAAMYAALPLFFGGISQEQQGHIERQMANLRYTFAKHGKGARVLHSLMLDLAVRFRKVGGQISEVTVMRQTIDKFSLVRDGVDVYEHRCSTLMDKLDDGDLVSAKLRERMMAAEEKAEEKMSVERPAGSMATTGGGGGAPVTGGGGGC